MFSGEELIPRLKDLYRTMDSTYADAAKGAGFSCKGCDGVKCCTVDLALHAYREMLYLSHGFHTLCPALQTEIILRCRKIIGEKRRNPLGQVHRNAVCVLNFNGLCSLYEYRPMICRLAGIGHFFVRPDGTRIAGPGCLRFQTDCVGGDSYPLIDRTPFYKEMAEMEMEVVRARGERTEASTVAEVIESAGKGRKMAHGNRRD